MRPPLAETGYLARGLLLCAPCATELAPALWREWRVYSCAGCNGGRGRWVDAELVDSEVWTRLAMVRPDLAAGVSGERRHEVIVRVVRRVEVTNPFPMVFELRGDDECC